MPLDLDNSWLIDHKTFTISPNHALPAREGDAVIGEDRGLSFGIHVNERR